jgi:predicted component of type VI protein secretion system
VPWIQISANGEELDRRELIAAVVIGRSSECDIVVRDILLSRTHCRLEPLGEGWRVVDLNSKNGTRVGWQDVRLHVMRDGDHLRMGRTRIVYHTGVFEPAKQKSPRADRIIRPADPHEALTGTVTDFVLLDEEQSDAEAIESYTDHPFPQPRALDPVLENESSASALIDDVASSFWCRQGDSNDVATATATGSMTTTLVASPRLTMRALPRRMSARPGYRTIRRSIAVETDLSLQADLVPIEVETLVFPKHTRRRRFAAVAGMVVAGMLGTGIVVMSIWLLTLAP